MPRTEQPLEDEQREEIERYAEQGLKPLQLDGNAESITVVKAIARYIGEQRQRTDQLSEDEYARIILEMGWLWGEQVRRAHGWEWVQLSTSGGFSTGLVSPDRSFCTYPLHFIKKFMDDPDREDTIILSFNLLAEPRVPGSKPGAYIALG